MYIHFDDVKTAASNINLISKAAYFKLVGELIKIIEDNTPAKILVAGNGGSAAIANHFAADLTVSVRKRTRDRSIDARSLTSNDSMFSALSNDDGYDNVFVNVAESITSDAEKIMVIAVTSSGNSSNIVRLLDWAKDWDFPHFALVGFDGGIVKQDGFCCIHVPSNQYEVVEDVHMMILHSLIRDIKEYFQKD